MTLFKYVYLYKQIKTNDSFVQVTNCRSVRRTIELFRTFQSSTTTLCGIVDKLHAASAVQTPPICRLTTYYALLTL